MFHTISRPSLHVSKVRNAFLRGDITSKCSFNKQEDTIITHIQYASSQNGYVVQTITRYFVFDNHYASIKEKNHEEALFISYKLPKCLKRHFMYVEDILFTMRMSVI